MRETEAESRGVPQVAAFWRWGSLSGTGLCFCSVCTVSSTLGVSSKLLLETSVLLMFLLLQSWLKSQPCRSSSRVLDSLHRGGWSLDPAPKGLHFDAFSISRGKLRHREGKGCAQGHQAGQWQRVGGSGHGLSSSCSLSLQLQSQHPYFPQLHIKCVTSPAPLGALLPSETHHPLPRNC